MRWEFASQEFRNPGLAFYADIDPDRARLRQFHPLSLSSLSFSFVRKIGGRKSEEKEGGEKDARSTLGCGCPGGN
jgi:hypothetical protein